MWDYSVESSIRSDDRHGWFSIKHSYIYVVIEIQPSSLCRPPPLTNHFTSKTSFSDIQMGKVRNTNYELNIKLISSL